MIQEIVHAVARSVAFATRPAFELPTGMWVLRQMVATPRRSDEYQHFDALYSLYTAVIDFIEEESAPNFDKLTSAVRRVTMTKPLQNKG